MTDRPSTTLLHLTPHLLARMEALGFTPGSEGALPWLIGLAEEQRAEASDMQKAHAETVDYLLEQRDALTKERDEARAESEELRRAEAAVLYLPEGGADLGFAPSSVGWAKGDDDDLIEIEDYTAFPHPDGAPYSRSHYRKNSLISFSFHRSPRAAMKADS